MVGPVMSKVQPLNVSRGTHRGPNVSAMKSDEASRLRRLAAKIEIDHPETVVHGHLRDAARALDSGRVKAASRHLSLARHTLTPLQLYRHGVTNGADHATARLNAGEIDRRMLALRDINDIEQDNTEETAARRAQQAAEAERKADPNRPMGPANMRPGEQSSPVRQSGSSNPTTGEKQNMANLAEWHHAMSAIELVGPKGWEHGWHYVGGPGLPASPGHSASRPAPKTKRVQVRHEGIGTHGVYLDGKRVGGIVSLGGGLHYASYEDGRPSTPHGSATDAAKYIVKAARNPVPQTIQTANEFSAQTGALATTPHPFGKPGGPGLWDVKGMELPPYIQNIAHALLRKGRAKTLGQAIAMAKAATSRWAAGKNTTPEVRAASAATNADWAAKRARAHAHALTRQDLRQIWELAWQISERVIELTGTAAGAAQDTRTPTGQFGTASKAKTPDAHQKHMAHVQHLKDLVAQGKATPAQKAALAKILASTKTSTKGSAASKSVPKATATAPRVSSTALALAAKKHTEHVEHALHLQHLVNTGKATAAEKAELVKIKAASGQKK
jgi:hypothetical protein